MWSRSSFCTSFHMGWKQSQYCMRYISSSQDQSKDCLRGSLCTSLSKCWNKALTMDSLWAPLLPFSTHTAQCSPWNLHSCKPSSPNTQMLWSSAAHIVESQHHTFGTHCKQKISLHTASPLHHKTHHLCSLSSGCICELPANKFSLQYIESWSLCIDWLSGRKIGPDCILNCMRCILFELGRSIGLRCKLIGSRCTCSDVMSIFRCVHICPWCLRKCFCLECKLG